MGPRPGQKVSIGACAPPGRLEQASSRRALFCAFSGGARVRRYALKITDTVNDHLQTVVNKSKEPTAALAQMARDVEGLLPKRS
jgi:hypothetical protein